MPLILNEISTIDFRILIWNIQETEEQLKKFINEPEKILFDLLSGVNHPQRKKQKIVAKILLNMLSDEMVVHQYTTEGKPILVTPSGHISISHSEDYVALIYHKTKLIGVDIEKPNNRIQHISGRFINDEELVWANLSKLHLFSLIWGIKESVFKAIGGGGIIFKKNIIVSKPYENNESVGKGYVIYNKENKVQKFQYHFRYLEDYLLVYTIAEN